MPFGNGDEESSRKVIGCSLLITAADMLLLHTSRNTALNDDAPIRSLHVSVIKRPEQTGPLATRC
jgi:hypothetical protein